MYFRDWVCRKYFGNTLDYEFAEAFRKGLQDAKACSIKTELDVSIWSAITVRASSDAKIVVNDVRGNSQ